MYIRTTGIIGRACAVRINYRKWVGTSVDSTDPSHFEFRYLFMLSYFMFSFLLCHLAAYKRSNSKSKVARLLTKYH